MRFRCGRCGKWGLRINNVCDPCWKQECKEVSRLVKQRGWK